jgi:hypothetical protein
MAAQLPDLSAQRELILWCATLIAILLVFLRVNLVARHGWLPEAAYPAAWTPTQLQFFRRALNIVGFILMGAWLVLFSVSPFFPVRYPFSQSNAVVLIGLLVLTYAWLAMARPHEWTLTPIAHVNFNHVFCGVLAWWTTALGLIFYWIGKFSIPYMFREPPIVPGIYA